MKKLRQLIAALIIEIMIFLPLTAVAQDNATSNEDNTPPFIEATIPSFVTTNRIDIEGTTEPMATVYLYVNGVKQRKSTPNTGGTFNFPSVDLSPLVAANSLKLESVDSANNINVKEFSVVVDLTTPEITINTKIPDLVENTTFTISGDISEPSQLTISVNNASAVSEPNVSAFEKQISLSEGFNDIIITASDRANNIDTAAIKTYLDTQPPVIEEITPSTGSFFYETDTKTDISGKTEPYTKLAIYIETREISSTTGETTAKREKIASTESDESGNFKFSDADISGRTEVIPGFLTVSGAGDIPSQTTAGSTVPEIERPPEEQPINLVLVATDRAGHESELQLNYRIGTCYGGGFDWNVINMIEYQSPTSLSPERLEEGTEVISFILNISYQGAGRNPVIKSVRFDKACEATSMAEDNLYMYSCQVLPTTPITKPNDAKTLWYVRYNLKKLEGIDDFSDDVWEDLTRQFKFPLKVKIEYTHELLNESGRYKEVRAYQTKCMDFAFHADTSRIDPRDVLPDWLLYNATEVINQTIQNLDDIIEGIDKVMTYIGGACTAMLAVRVVTTIYRRWVSHSEYIEGKISSSSGKPPCPAPGAGDFGKIKKGLTSDQVLGDSLADDKQLGALKQDDLPNNYSAKYPMSETYNLLTLCPKTYAVWEREAKVYQAYRWACDRFLCRGAPARWTELKNPKPGDEEKKDQEIRLKIQKAAACTQETGSTGAILRKYPAEKCTFAGVTDKSKCWIYNGGVYTTGEKSGELTLVGGTGITGGKPGDIPSTLTVTESSGNVLFQEQKGKCNDLCTKKVAGKAKYEEGKCLTSLQLTEEIKKDGKTVKTATLLKDVSSKADCSSDTMCYCLNTVGKVKLPPDPNEWNYRYEKLDYYYDPYRYYEGRDKPACFGQNSWLSKTEPYLSVQDAWPAFQCLCIPQIRNRFVLFKNILSGLHNCLIQIRTTGEADTGVCKEMFTQYICKWLVRLVTAFTKGCTPWSGGGTEPDKGIGDKVSGGIGAIFGGVQEATSELFDDYDNTALQNYLTGGEGTIAEAVCMGALTGDWGIDMEGIIDSAYSQPYHSSASAWPADREYLTWDPDSEQATYEYRVAWMITPGCAIEKYTISLACVSDFELYNFDNVACEQAKGSSSDDNDNSPSGCDCTSDAGSGVAGRVNQAAPGPSKVIYTGSALTQGSFESRSVHSVQTGFQRYDNVKITLYINDPKVAQQCIPEGHLVGNRMGVFYSPISDATTYDIVACRFDQTQGYFRCDQGRLLWNLRGKAYFGRVQCDGVPCDQQVYYLGDPIKLNPFEVYVQGQKQCLYMQVENKAGQKLLGQNEQGLFVDLETDQSDPARTILKSELNEQLLLPEITDDSFRREPPRIEIDEVKFQQLDVIGDVTARRTYIDFADTNDDGKPDEFRVADGIFTPYADNHEEYIFGFKVLFTEVNVPKGASGSKQCQNITENQKRCVRNTVTITEPAIKTATEQEWTINLELRHAPGNRSQGSCSESRREDLISYQGEPQRKQIKIRVRPGTEKDYSACQYRAGTTPNSNLCDCNQDGDTEDKEDCDGISKKYCKDKVCSPYPACTPSNLPNSVDCDCDWDGKLGDIDGKNCLGKYCYNKKCYTEQEMKEKKEEEAAEKAIQEEIAEAQAGREEDVQREQAEAAAAQADNTTPSAPATTPTTPSAPAESLKFRIILGGKTLHYLSDGGRYNVGEFTKVGSQAYITFEQGFRDALDRIITEDINESKAREIVCENVYKYKDLKGDNLIYPVVLKEAGKDTPTLAQHQSLYREACR